MPTREPGLGPGTKKQASSLSRTHRKNLVGTLSQKAERERTQEDALGGRDPGLLGEVAVGSPRPKVEGR